MRVYRKKFVVHVDKITPKEKELLFLLPNRVLTTSCSRNAQAELLLATKKRASKLSKVTGGQRRLVFIQLLLQKRTSINYKRILPIFIFECHTFSAIKAYSEKS
uniref:Uncharacterized protein n=1 Tax=Ditylenchus dipsaci TaxID=166011 RepID=A0A915CW28_9BILA